jgi:hypothetical protein
VAGATRPVQGGAYSGPRSEPGGQNTPRAGRVVASYGTYTSALGAFAQQVDQGFLTSSYDAVIEADNPVSHWKLGNSTVTVEDRKGVRDLPAVNGPIATATGLVDKNAGGLANTFAAASSQRFGSDAAVTNAGLPYESNAFTVEAWIKEAGVSHEIVSRFTSAALSVSGTSLRLSVNAGGTTVTVESALGVINVDTTYYVAATYDGANVILYVNGVEVERAAVTGAVLSLPDYPPTIGSITGGGSYFDGVIDEVAWYNTALSAARIAAHHQAGHDDVGFGTVTASGSSSESSNYADSGTATVTASGSGVEAYSYSFTDSASGTITASGNAIEAGDYSDSSAGTATASGSSSESYAPDSYSADIVTTPGLLSYWRLSDPSGAAVDEKGLSDGTYNGTVTRDAPGVIAALDTAASFPGTAGSYINVPSQAAYDTGAQVTVEAWIKPASVAAAKIVARSAASTVWFIEIIAAARLRWYLRDANQVDTSVQDTAVLVVGQRYHIACTYDAAGTMKLYINGVASAVAPNRTPNANGRAGTGQAIAIGAEGASTGSFNGTVDEVAVYNVALDAAAVGRHYLAGTGAVAYTDSGSGTVTGSGTGVEGYAYADSGAGTVTASGTGAESAARSASGTCTATASGTALESASADDAGTCTATASGAGVGGHIGTGGRTGTVTASGTGAEAYAFSDSGTCTATASGAGAEAASADDAATCTATVSGSGVGGHIGTGGRTCTVTASGTGAESYTVGYSDTGSGTISSTGSGTDSHSYDYSASGAITASGTGAEDGAYADSASATTNATGSGTDSHSYDFSTTGTVATSGTGAESYSCTDSAAGTSIVLGSGTESYVVVASTALLIATVI